MGDWMTKKKDTRPVKCPYCEDRLPRGEAIRHTNGRYYHKDCYEEATAESRHYKELIETICEIWGIDKPTMQMLMQIKRYKEDPNPETRCTYKGMELTLRYFYDLLGNNPRDGDGVGIIPWMYHEARDHHARIIEIQKDMEDFNTNKEEKKIVITRPQRRGTRRATKIDIESL